jgi:hypothetical protein
MRPDGTIGKACAAPPGRNSTVPRGWPRPGGRASSARIASCPGRGFLPKRPARLERAISFCEGYCPARAEKSSAKIFRPRAPKSFAEGFWRFAAAQSIALKFSAAPSLMPLNQRAVTVLVRV